MRVAKICHSLMNHVLINRALLTISIMDKGFICLPRGR